MYQKKDMKHQKEEPVSILKDRPGCPPELADICKKMMAKDLDERYQTAEEVREALGDWMAGQTSAYVHPGDSEDLADFAAGLREEKDGNDSFDSESMSIEVSFTPGSIGLKAAALRLASEDRFARIVARAP